MARLRKLQDAYAEDLGPLGYACSTAWLAALFARTELCIRARTRLIGEPCNPATFSPRLSCTSSNRSSPRLTGRLLAMERTRLQALQAACRPLADSALPELIALFASKKAGECHRHKCIRYNCNRHESDLSAPSHICTRLC